MLVGLFPNPVLLHRLWDPPQGVRQTPGMPDADPTAAPAADPAALLELAVRLARDAGELALRMREGIRSESTKTSPTDVVTAADRAVERLLTEGIREARPDDGLLGEEGAAVPGTSGLRWVVDPIDGTVNYLYGLPQWAVSIGVEDADGTVVGVVLDPAKGELFTAVRGGGAFLDGRPLRCTGVTDLGQALVATGFGYDARRRAAQARLLPDLLPRVRDLRRVGAGALDLCAVACGRVDAYYEQGLSPWDLSAGRLVATEAGARVEGLRGRDGRLRDGAGRRPGRVRRPARPAGRARRRRRPVLSRLSRHRPGYGVRCSSRNSCSSRRPRAVSVCRKRSLGLSGPRPAGGRCPSGRAGTAEARRARAAVHARLSGEGTGSTSASAGKRAAFQSAIRTTTLTKTSRPTRARSSTPSDSTGPGPPLEDYRARWPARSTRS